MVDSSATTSVVVSISCPHCDLACAQSDVGFFCNACDWREDRCQQCGDIMLFTPRHRGFTVGGLAFVGALCCERCGIFHLCRRSKPASDTSEWTLARNGLSVVAGAVTVRAERATEGQARALMSRIARVPEHEANEIELERLYDLLARPGWARNRC